MEDEEEEEEAWEIVKVVNVRRTSSGGLEMEVEWAGTNADGQPWPMDWIPEEWATSATVAEALELETSRAPAPNVVALAPAQISPQPAQVSPNPPG